MSSSLLNDLAKLREVLRPALEAEQAQWAEHGPAALQRAATLGITIDGVGGNCPVQAEGSFDSKRFYFRARGDEWQFHAWPTELVSTPGHLPFGRECFYIEQAYEGGQYDAGWMPRHEAVGFICDAAEKARSTPAQPGDREVDRHGSPR